MKGTERKWDVFHKHIQFIRSKHPRWIDSPGQRMWNSINMIFRSKKKPPQKNLTHLTMKFPQKSDDCRHESVPRSTHCHIGTCSALTSLAVISPLLLRTDDIHTSWRLHSNIYWRIPLSQRQEARLDNNSSFISNPMLQNNNKQWTEIRPFCNPCRIVLGCFFSFPYFWKGSVYTTLVTRNSQWLRWIYPM